MMHVECRRCGAVQKFKTRPTKAVLCCSNPKGVTLLFVRVLDDEAGTMELVATTRARVVFPLRSRKRATLTKGSTR